MAVIGNTLKNSYRIVDKLGEGGQTRVYLAFAVSLNKKCVVKEMKTSPDPADEQECLTLFQREYTLLKDLSHPLLVKVHDFFQENGLWYIVEDFVEGKTLEVVLKKSSFLSEDMAVLIAVDLADVLGYLHQNNIIYRDIKPANIVIDNNQKARLIDFTIARVYKSGKSKDTVCIGTPGYSPPEQYGRKQTDARSDVYALGALLHELVTGRDPAEMPFTFRFSQPYSIIKPVIEKATNLDPDKRYQSMAEFKKSLLEEHSKPKPTVAQPLPPLKLTSQIPAVSQQVPLSPVQKAFLLHSKPQSSQQTQMTPWQIATSMSAKSQIPQTQQGQTSWQIATSQAQTQTPAVPKQKDDLLALLLFAPFLFLLLKLASAGDWDFFLFLLVVLLLGGGIAYLLIMLTRKP